RLIEEFQRIAASVSSVYGVTTGFAQHCFYPAVINDAALVDRVRPLIDRPLPQEALLTAEDFSFFGKERPAVYAFVGAGDEQRSAPLHSDQFDFDEAALLPVLDWYTRIIDTCAKED
ncbi:MAG: M20/M25/M40 family metallo-hydrolase, partial [Candidatus Spyradocola sp.]